MVNAIPQRRIDLTFRLGTGTFGETGTNTLKVTGGRVRCHIEQNGGPNFGLAQVRVVGLTMSTMNQLSGLNANTIMRRNSIAIEAGNVGDTALAVVFQGQITVSQLDGSAAPEIGINIIANGGMLQALQPAQATSYPGAANAADIMGTLAGKMGFGFQNHGVNFPMASPYYWGPYWRQAQDVAHDARIAWTVTPDQVLHIYPAVTQPSQQIPVFSPGTGLVGYPSQWDAGPAFRIEFNPYINFFDWFAVEKSAISIANGKWQAVRVSHDIDAETPGGAWFTNLQGMNLAALGQPNG